MLPVPGTDVSFARRIDRDRDLNDYQAFIRRILRKKSPKLQRYRAEGFETWLIIYNTMWPVFSPVQIKQFIAQELTADNHHLDHIACAGPDRWINIVH